MKRVIKHKFDTSKYVIVDSRGKRVMNNEDKLIEELRLVSGVSKNMAKRMAKIVQVHDILLIKALPATRNGRFDKSDVIKAIEGK